jgi:hypothetical protein
VEIGSRYPRMVLIIAHTINRTRRVSRAAGAFATRTLRQKGCGQQTQSSCEFSAIHIFPPASSLSFRISKEQIGY